MQNILDKIFQEARFFSFAVLCSLAIVCISFAATNSIQVQQTVTQEGNGTIGNGSGGIVLPIDATPPVIFDVKIYDIDQHAAKISWKTQEPCFAELKYGKTKNYEFGPLFAHPDSYLNYHEFALSNLESGEKYYLEIKAKNQKGAENVITDYSFYSIPEFLIVSNAGSLTAVQKDKKIILNWENSAEKDFRGVQINKKIDSPALNPSDGEKIFSGSAENIVDVNVADKTTYFYTVFSYDASGNFSSGVFISVKTNFEKLENGGEGKPPAGAKMGIEDVINLKVAPDFKNKKIVLGWQCPQMKKVCNVEIRRDTNFPVVSPFLGNLVYSGSGTSFDDIAIEKERMYFYTVFVRDKNGEYSKGKVVTSELIESDRSFNQEGWKDVSFVDAESGVLLVPENDDKISIFEGHILGINYGADVLPSDLKTIVAQVKGASYILDFDKNTQSYKTSFIVSKNGKYEFRIAFIDSGNQIIFDKKMKLDVVPAGSVYFKKNEKLFAFPLSLEKIICRFENLLGGDNLKCVTKTGIEGAEVRIFKKAEEAGWELWNASKFKQNNPSLADKDGKFGFTVPNGEYAMAVKKNGFEDRNTIISVHNNTIGEKIEIHAKANRNYGILMLLILVILLLINLKKRFVYKKKTGVNIIKK